MLQPKDTEWLNGYKNKTNIYVVYRRPTSVLQTYTYWKWEDGKKIFHANRNQKKAGVAILISGKIDFKNKNCYKRQRRTLQNGEINNNTVIVGHFKTPLTAMDRKSRQKINKETQALNDPLDQMNLTDIYRPFWPKATKYTLFSSTYGTFSRTDHILGHKSSLRKFKMIEITSSIFSDHNSIRIEINYEKKKTCVCGGGPQHMETKQYATKPMDHWRNQIISRDKLKQKDNNPKLTECCKSSSKREVHSNTKLTLGNKKNLK